MQSTSESFRFAVIEAARLRRVEKGNWLFGVGDETSGPIAVMTGTLAFDLPVLNGAQYSEWPVQPGHWIGTGALIMGNCRQANVRAIVASEIAELPASILRRILQAEPEAWRYLGMNVVQNSQVAISVAASLMTRRAKPRVAAILMVLSQSGFVDDPKHVPIHLTQAEVARLCALSRPVLSGILSEFDQKGLTRTGYGTVEVLDATGLQDIASAA